MILTLCPWSLAMPHSATTSHTMTAVSLLPDTSRSPARSQARQLTAVLCPVKVTSTSRVPVSHNLEKYILCVNKYFQQENQIHT